MNRTVTRRTLLRSAAVATGTAGVLTALPGLAHADERQPAKPDGVDPAGAGAPDEAGASLSGATTPLAAPPVDLTVPATPAATAPVTAALPYKNFLRYDFELRDLPPELMPYALHNPTPLPYGLVDASGVRVVNRGGVIWNHPTAQAQYGMALLEGYRLTSDPSYLAAAVAQATRLTSRAQLWQGGRFHPYDFANAPHSTTIRNPPWYSAIAQGQVLDFYTRLFNVTQDPKHKAMADATFASFLVPMVAGKPWVTWVNAGLLWLDEYPRTDIALGDRTYNGHTFAAFGLYSYYKLTGDERAKQLAQGAITTTRAVAPQIRVPGARSVYCLQDRAFSGGYHMIHSNQNLILSTITGEPTFATVADNFHLDFPDPSVTGTVLIQPGTYKAFKFNADGSVPATRLLTATKLTSAPCSSRTKIANRTGIWYQISAGTVAGYYLLERPGYVYLGGSCLPMPYLPYRTGTLTSDVPTAYQPPPTLLANRLSKAVGLTKGAQVLIKERLTFNGVEYLELADPTNDGWFVPAAQVAL